MLRMNSTPIATNARVKPESLPIGCSAVAKMLSFPISLEKCSKTGDGLLLTATVSLRN